MLSRGANSESKCSPVSFDFERKRDEFQQPPIYRQAQVSQENIMFEVVSSVVRKECTVNLPHVEEQVNGAKCNRVSNMSETDICKDAQCNESSVHCASCRCSQNQLANSNPSAIFPNESKCKEISLSEHSYSLCNKSMPNWQTVTEDSTVLDNALHPVLSEALETSEETNPDTDSRPLTSENRKCEGFSVTQMISNCLRNDCRVSIERLNFNKLHRLPDTTPCNSNSVEISDSSQLAKLNADSYFFESRIQTETCGSFEKTASAHLVDICYNAPTVESQKIYQTMSLDACHTAANFSDAFNGDHLEKPQLYEKTGACLDEADEIKLSTISSPASEESLKLLRCKSMIMKAKLKNAILGTMGNVRTESSKDTDLPRAKEDSESHDNLVIIHRIIFPIIY